MAAPERYQHAPTATTPKVLARRWWGAELVTVHADGTAADLDPSPPSGACRLALSTDEGRRRCAASIARAREKATLQEGLTQHVCHLDFTLRAAAMPDGGALVACGVREAVPDERERRRLEERLLELRPAVAQGPLPSPPALSPFELARLDDLVTLTAHDPPDRAEARAGRTRGPKRSHDAPPIIGQSVAMLEVQRLVERVAQGDATVLIQGESGTGKELVARRIHDLGPRHDRPFVAQNCSALNDNLLESALFGHVRGAFTGATSNARGLFELAEGGTLFLDEIGDMSPALQAKLLRVLQEGTFTPVGGATEHRSDVRVLAASHAELAALVREGKFREDLYYRVNVIRLIVPPLRERDDDVDLLIAWFLRRFGARARIAPEALERLRAWSWPGNVRELQNEIERMCVLAPPDATELGLELLSPRIAASRVEPAPARSLEVGDGPLPLLNDAVESLERTLLAEALKRTNGNQSAVARLLGVARSNLVVKLARYGLAKPRRRGR